MNTVTTKSAISFSCKEEDIVWSKQELTPEGWLLTPPASAWDKKMRCIKIYQNDSKTPVAMAWVDKAETSWLQNTTDLPASRLNQSILLWGMWIAPTAKAWTPAMLYLALRRGRIWGRKQMIALVDKNQLVNLSLLRVIPIDNTTPINQDNKKLSFYAQQIPYGAHLCYQHCQGGDPLKLIHQEFPTEIIETVKIFLQNFFANKWSQAVLNGTMSKQQYIQCLFNTHSYVRQTTRLIARCVAATENEDLRNHYINHLKGEINHEKIIERDLNYLGADVDYLTKYFVPNLATKEFMITQESTIAFWQNSIWMLACPLAAEGITATITPDFLESLKKMLASWGIAKPEEAMRFISSHSHTDGGEDGHWENVQKMIWRFLNSEYDLQHFLNIFAIAAEGLQRSFESSIEENMLWNKMPA